jgi:hypothetical protein
VQHLLSPWRDILQICRVNSTVASHTYAQRINSEAFAHFYLPRISQSPLCLRDTRIRSQAASSRHVPFSMQRPCGTLVTACRWRPAQEANTCTVVLVHKTVYHPKLCNNPEEGRFITVLIRARRLFPSSATCIYSKLTCPTSRRPWPNITVTSTVNLASGLLPQVSPPKPSTVFHPMRATWPVKTALITQYYSVRNANQEPTQQAQAASSAPFSRAASICAPPSMSHAQTKTTHS